MRAVLLSYSVIGLLLATKVTAADSAAAAKASQATLSEAAVQKAVVDYKRTADDITTGRGAKPISGPFKAAVMPAKSAAVGEAPTTTTAQPPPAPNATAVATAMPVKSPAIAQFAKQAEEARAQGNWSAVLRTWSEAEKLAQSAGDRAGVAQAALNQARMLQQLPVAEPEQQRQRQGEIITKYRTAIEALPRPQQAFARNNLAVVYLQNQDATNASAVMREVDWKSVEPEYLALCRYNFGRAEETAGNVAAAVKQYRMALEREPDFAPAVEAVFRVLANAGDAAQIADVGADLVRRNEAAAAAPHLRDALPAVATTEKADAVLVALVQACAAARIAPPDYTREYAKPLSTAAEKAPPLRGLVAELAQAYASELPVDLEGHRVRSALPGWARAGRQEAMSRLLQTIGDFHSRPAGGRRSKERGATESGANARLALISYAAAWALDRGNTDAPVYAAAMLQEHRELDQNGALLGVLIDRLFQQKGEAIGIPVKSADDLRNLMRLHLVLGTIFEKAEIWGPKWQPRSATFQLSHAIALQEELRKADPGFAVSADLYARAAKAYEQAREPALALEFHTRAAEAYLYFRDASKARLSRDAALGLPNAREAEYQVRLAAVASKLEQL